MARYRFFFSIWFVLEEEEESEGKENGRNKGLVFETRGFGKGRRRRRDVIVKVRDHWIWRVKTWWIPSIASSASAAADTKGRELQRPARRWWRAVRDERRGWWHWRKRRGKNWRRRRRNWLTWVAAFSADYA